MEAKHREKPSTSLGAPAVAGLWETAVEEEEEEVVERGIIRRQVFH